ncbi:integrase arm-type DNA-binding domain-containing protein [Alcanivorax sp. S6407]|uniref:tyrosine-type recombinase/integrase n=1 Tax=Alcanivorax sp. S6407 TaxID=2926424 RepID=UPI001FF54192|nr:integrase arm-type DNA-binding domain-containing protein [Alcanivorax sp. S6407]MCK0153753.1 integrase arm-type DNA-binding domain-containing protein [Alcanivorax sp. S6407]
MALTAADVRNATALKKPYKLNDSKGLYLLVETDGQRTWKLAYRFNDRDKVITFGPYPEVSLESARHLRKEVRELIADGIDPISRCEKREIFRPSLATFETVANDWLERVYRLEVSEEQFRRTKRQLENYLIASVGKRVVSEVTPEDLKSLATALGAEGHVEKGKRVLGIAKRVYQHARDTGVAGYQHTAALHKRLTGSGTEPEFLISTREKLTRLASDVLGQWGRSTSSAALKLTVWLLAKPSEIVNAKWSDMDLDAGEWRIRRTQPDTGEERIITVPLPRQAVELLRELEPLTGRQEYVFPGSNDRHKHLGSSSISKTLKKVTRGDLVNTDNLRTLAATALGELGYQAEQIQAQLLDQDAEQPDREGYAEKRREMLQDWADYLEGTLLGKVARR